MMRKQLVERGAHSTPMEGRYIAISTTGCLSEQCTSGNRVTSHSVVPDTLYDLSLNLVRRGRDRDHRENVIATIPCRQRTGRAFRWKYHSDKYERLTYLVPRSLISRNDCAVAVRVLVSCSNCCILRQCVTNCVVIYE